MGKTRIKSIIKGPGFLMKLIVCLRKICGTGSGFSMRWWFPLHRCDFAVDCVKEKVGIF